MMRSLITSRMGSGILAGFLLEGKIGGANARAGWLKPGHKDETTTPSRDFVETLQITFSKYFCPSLGLIIE